MLYAYIKKLRQSSSQRGFTLLIAALIASIVLTLASAIFDIAQKQVTLASLSQQSQYAFYAADTAAECALYWDVRFSYFAVITPTLSPAPICDGQTLTVAPQFSAISPPANTNDYTQKFTFSPNGYCANVSVHKCQGAITSGGLCCPNEGVTNGVCDPSKSVTSISTQIHADGFNYAPPCNPATVSPTALERSVNLNY